MGRKPIHRPGYELGASNSTPDRPLKTPVCVQTDTSVSVSFQPSKLNVDGSNPFARSDLTRTYITSTSVRAGPVAVFGAGVASSEDCAALTRRGLTLVH